ncbi:hypothetical protein QBE52_10955 [Clostridiaceae bacterium 35-E11]
MNIFILFIHFFIYIAHSIIGIIWAKKWRFSPILGGIMGFAFVPIFFHFLPLLSDRFNIDISNNK